MNEKQKKEIINHTIQILIGILVIIPLFNEKSWLRFIALGGFLLIISNIIWFIRNSEEILFKIFPVKSIREEKPKLKDKICEYISIVLFSFGILFLFFQMNNIENTVEESDVWKNFGLIGFVIGLLSLFLLNKIRPSIFHESGRRYAVIFGFILGLTFISISTASFINSNYAVSNITESRHVIERKSTGGRKGKSHWIFIKIDNSEKRFEISERLWNQLNVGDAVLLELQKGYLDFTIVKKIKHTLTKNKKIPPFLRGFNT